jgi:hypothetical protein
MNLSDREIAMVLAALRHWQWSDDDLAGLEFRDFFTEHEPLAADEIDSLCERLNMGDEK